MIVLKILFIFAIRCKPCYRFPPSAGGGKSGQYRAMHPAISGGISTNAEKQVEVTESATENNCLLPLQKKRVGVRMKMWGKSPQLLVVTSFAGKPCMLKCHV